MVRIFLEFQRNLIYFFLLFPLFFLASFHLLSSSSFSLTSLFGSFIRFVSLMYLNSAGIASGFDKSTRIDLASRLRIAFVCSLYTSYSLHSMR